MRPATFRLLTQALKDNRPCNHHGDMEIQWRKDVKCVAEALENADPAGFDRDRFLRVCGLRPADYD